MPTMENITVFGANVTAIITRYNSPRNPAIQCFNEQGPYGTASVNLPFELNPNLIAIKNWSENEGIEEELQDAGIIGQKVGEVPQGYVDIPIYELLIKPD